MNSFLNQSKLGSGLMWPPMKDDQIDMALLCDMVDEAMKNGFNYFDTAFVYHGGQSERAMKAALVDRYPRDSFVVADGSRYLYPLWAV